MNYYFLVMSIIYINLYSTITTAAAQKLVEEENELYDECISGNENNGTVFCYGDTETCVKEKSCLYLTTLKETDEIFQVYFLDRCNHTLKNLKSRQFIHAMLFGIGVATYDNQGDADCSVPLEMKHFKFFLFWNNLKCPNEQQLVGNESSITEFQITKENWTSICENKKNELKKLKPPLEKEPAVFLLIPYLERHVYFSTVFGTWKNKKSRYSFAKSHKYFTNDGIFYASNDTSADFQRSKGFSKIPLPALIGLMIASVPFIVHGYF